MKRILHDPDDKTAARPEAIAPARGGERSAFIRAAILGAIEAHDDQQAEAAYRRQPDKEPAFRDGATWDVLPPLPPLRAHPQTKRKR